MKSFLKYFFRIALFGVVCVFLFRKVNVLVITRSFVYVNNPYILLGLSLYFLKYIVQAIRWQLACSAYQIKISFFQLIRAQLEIMFLEIAFPLPDSEDGFRIANVYSCGASISESIAIIAYDRMIGVLLLCSIIPFTLVEYAHSVFRRYSLNIGLIFPLILSLTLILLFYRSLLIRLIIWEERRMGRELSFLIEIKKLLKQKIKGKILLASISTAILHASIATFVPWLLVASAGHEVSFVHLFIAAPLFYISAIMPVSYQGLGLYETALVYILNTLGVPLDSCLLIGMIHFLFHIVVVMSGALIYLFNGNKNQLESILLMLKDKALKLK